MATNTATKPTRFAMYQEALKQLQQAFDELDQAQASMKAAGVDDVKSGGGLSIQRIITQVESLMAELKTAECGDCDHRISLHGDTYGCEYERGDHYVGCRDGGTVLAAIGPCQCGWGLEAAGGVR